MPFLLAFNYSPPYSNVFVVVAVVEFGQVLV